MDGQPLSPERVAPAARTRRALPDWAAKAFILLLIVVHAGMAIFAVGGIIEWFAPETPWPQLSNWRYPQLMHYLQWPFLLGTAAIFLVGYARRWPHLPVAMTIAYVTLAATCAVQTFGYLDHPSRFREMAIEYAEYVIILVFLFRGSYVQRRLHGRLTGRPR